MEDRAFHADSALLDTVFDGVVLIDLKTLSITRANKAAADIMGFDSPEEMVGVKPLASVCEDDRQLAAGLVASVVSGRSLENGVEVRAVDKRGREMWVLARGVSLPSNGSTMLLASFRDVTAQKQAEIALRQAEERQLQLLNTSHELILISQDWKVVFVNRRLEEATGISGGTLTGMSILDMTHPDDREAVRRAYQKMLDGNPTASSRPFKGIGKDGKEAWGLMRHVPFTWQGRPALMTVIQDITEQKVATEALRESEQKYRDLAEKTNDIIWTADLGFRVTYMSPSVERILGRTQAEVTGHVMQDFITPASWEQIVGVMAEQLRREMEGTGDLDEVVRTETEFYHKDGSSVWLENLASRIRDKEGQLIGIYGISRDVTERRRVEEEARLAAREWLDTFDSVTDMISVHDPDGRIIRANKAFAENLGMKPGEFHGRRCWELVHGTNAPWPNCPRQRCMAQGKSCEEELWEPRLGKYLHVSVSPIFNTQNEVAGSVHIARDVTDRKKTEEALQLSEGNFRALLENSAAVVFSLDTQANVTAISPAIERLSGFRPDEMIGLSALQWVVPEDVNTLISSVEKTLVGNLDPFVFRARYKNGSVHNMLTSGRPIYLDGKLTGLLGIMVDVTEAKAAEAALRASEANYRSLFEHTLMGLEVIDLETMKAVLASESMARIFGFESAAAMVGTEPLDLILPDDLDSVIAELTRVLADPGTHAMCTFRARSQDSRIVWVTAMANVFEFLCRRSILLSVLDVTAEKEAQMKVAESEEKNRLLIDTAGQGIIVIQDGALKFANPRCTEVSGYTNEELLSRSFLEIVHPDDRQLIADNYVNRISGNPAPNNYRFRLLDKSGSTKWLQINTVQLTWEGHPAVLSMLTDVTAMKEAEDALRDSESRYRLITENSSDVIWTMDMSLHMTYVSPSVEKLTGYTAEESMAMDMISNMTQGSLDKATRYLAEGLAGAQDTTGRVPVPEMMELEMMCKDGSTVWTEVQMSFLQDSEGKVVGVMGVARNIGERRRAKQALEESEQRFRALIEGARDAIMVIDLNGKVTYSSPTADRMTDGSVGALLSPERLGALHPDDVPRITAVFESLSKSPDGTVADIELRYRRKGGLWGVIEARGTNHVQDPKIGGIVINFRDITERRQAEEAFRESESRYRMLAENVSDVIWSLNMRTKQSFFSPSITRLLGYTVEEAQALKMSEVISPTSYPKAMMAFSNMPPQQGDGPGPASAAALLEIELIRKDGTFVWVDISETMVLDADGKPAEVFGVMRDVNERKKAEEALRSSEEYFRALIENAWDAIIIIDARGTLLYESPSSVRITGWQPQDVVGRSVGKFVHPDYLPGLVAKYEKFTSEPGSSITFNSSFKHKDGHYIECECTLHNLLNDPKINGVVANYRDITDRRRAEEAIRTSEERFRNLVEATSDWVWETDPRGIYTYVSPKVREVMGYEVGEIIGKSIFDYMPAKESSRFAITFQSAAARNEPFSFVENSRLHKDGRVVVMETSGVPFFADNGGLLGYRGIGRDITNRKKVERDLENSLKKVEKTMEAAIQAISYTMETRDPYTTGHQRRVTQLACAIAKEMGIGQWQMDGIRVAGLLHDIGKIAVPTEILSKPGKLSDIEFSMIKAHPKVGFDILQNVEFEWPIARIVVQHHERLNGSGYPFGIKGKDILLEARILAVADVVEAMSSHRPYRPALGLDRALDEVARGEGTLYDAEVVRACSRVISERNFKFEG
jgi:PAS domain S-box-containing protein/putative nucleotidyltransferase with HDIG domain